MTNGSTLWSELRRRHVVRTAVAYLVVGTAVGGAASDFLPGLGAPAWVVSVVLAVVVLGFPVALVLSWALQVTPSGVHREIEAPASAVAKAPLVEDRRESAIRVDESGADEAEAPAFDAKAIAVLPFSNFSGDESDAFFADGVGEDILMRLAQIPALHVISRTSVHRYKGTELSIAEIARELCVGSVLEGSVRRVGDRVRIVAQLIEAATDRHLWAETYDRDLTDIFEVQGDVAEHIADALKAHLAPDERTRLRRPLTDELEAYDRYLRGRAEIYRLRPEDIARGMELMEEAIRLDPRFASAYAQLALAHVAWSYYGRGNPGEDLDQAATLAERALELDPTSGLAWAARGFARYHSWRWPEAEADLREANKLDPGISDVPFMLGHHLNLAGRYAEALEPLRAASALTPHEAVPLLHIGIALLHLDRADEAIETLQRLVDVQPGFFEGPFALGAALVQAGQVEEGLHEMRRAVELSGGLFWPKGWLAAACRYAGHDEEARDLAAELRGPDGSPVGEVFAAIVEGDIEAAVSGLESLAELRHPLLLWVFRAFPWLKEMIGHHPTYVALEERIWGTAAGDEVRTARGSGPR